MQMEIQPSVDRKLNVQDAFMRCFSADSTLVREQMLEQLRIENPEIEAEVRSLLIASAGAGVVEQVFGFASHEAVAETNASGEPSATPTGHRSSIGIAEGLGTLIGPYKLLEQIGEGGMGSVFMAQQSTPFKRRVALKIIKPGMDTQQVVARFEAERQALALMDHTNIAKVLDAGTTQHGRPFFVMELVKGIPITEYCSREKLATKDRLRLFIDLCHGVQHAHQKGIIHRDLKPSNVLVTLHDGIPVVKIIDFGIAKAINQELTERTLFTHFSQMIGTPLYMSPEQAEISGLDVDTRSDVYSLGVLLYELLTGTTPFDKELLKGVGLDEIRRMIRETEPPRPSQRIGLKTGTHKAANDSTLRAKPSANELRAHRELKGELDWIVMKALEKERNRRYESPNAFAADVECYLSDEPVHACPPTFAYRMRKYTRRHKGLLTTATILVGVLLIATVVSISYVFEADRARNQANFEKNKAVAAQEQSDKNLVAALDAVEQLLLHASSPELTEIPDAQPIRRKILEDVLAFYEKSSIVTGDSATVRYRAALTWGSLAELGRDLGQYELSRKGWEKSLSVIDQLNIEFPANETYQGRALTLFVSLGFLHAYELKDLPGAREYFQRALNLAERLSVDDSKNKSLSIQNKINPLLGLARVGWLSGDKETHRKYVLAAFELSRGIKEISIETEISLAQQMGLAYRESDPDRADRHYRTAVTKSRERLQEQPTRFLKSEHSGLLTETTEFFTSQDTTFATELSNEAIQLAKRLLSDFPKMPTYEMRLERATLYRVRLLSVTAQENPGEIEDFETTLSADMDTPLVRWEFARAYEKVKQDRQADLSYEKAMRQGFAQEPLEPEFNYRLEMLAAGGSGTRARPAMAARWAKQAKMRNEHAEESYEKELNTEPLHPTFHYRLRTLAMGSSSLRADPVLALRLALRAEERLLDDSAEAVTLGIVLWKNQQMEQAVERFALAIKLNPSNNEAYHCRGEVFSEMGRYDEAIADQSKSIELNPKHAESWASRGTLLMRHFQRYQEALADFDISIELNPAPSYMYRRRFEATIELQRFDRALTDLDTLIRSNEAESYYQNYQAALLSLKLADLESYKARCLTMVTTIKVTDKPLAVHFAAWTCALAPNSLDNYTDAIELGRAAVEAEPGLCDK